MHLDEDDNGKQRTLSSGATLSPRGAYDIQATDEGAAKKRTASETSRERSAKTTAKEIARRTVKRTTDKAANTLPAIRRTKRSKKTMKTVIL